MIRVAVAIPVKDERERIAACLPALARQQDVRGHHAVLLNNCTDGTGAVIRELAPSLPMAVHVIERNFPSAHAGAGTARSLAMQHAARLLGPDGVLLTTDADGRVAPDWIAANLAALGDGAEVVAGQAALDPIEAARISSHLHEDDARECAYADLLDEIDALLDPDPADPWPRHSEHSGASIAVTLDAYRRAGGVPPVAVGEDRAFVEALRRVDARIRHAPGVRVTVSGRIDGRAKGGMAETIRRRMVRQDPLLDERLEPARDRHRRAALRAWFRAARTAGRCPPSLLHALRVTRAELAASLASAFAGAGWAMLETRSPVLVRRPVERLNLARETLCARQFRDALRRRGVQESNVVSFAPVSATNTASRLAGSAALAFSLTRCSLPGGSKNASPAL